MRRFAAALAAMALLTAALPAAAAVPAEPTWPSPEWFAREAANFAKLAEEPAAQASDPAFMAAWQERSATNIAEYLRRVYVDGSWPWDSRGNVCAYWAQQCAGDPRRYPGVDPFYEAEGEVVEVTYFDSGGALLSGRVWAPRSSGPGDALPGVVIETGSVQVSENAYWWFAQPLVRAGYVVMTFDVRGQGRSDNRDRSNRPGSNITSDVFVTNLVDTIDFFSSTPDTPYPVTGGRAAPTAAHNPFWDRLDRDRLGIVGHSLGATGVSVVQGIADWPGRLSDENPVDVAVAWDNLSGSGSLAGFPVVPRVPTMGQAGDYGLVSTPHLTHPSAEAKKGGFRAWRDAGVPTYQLVVEGGGHFEWSYLPTLPSTSWEDWGNPLVEHYSLAWLDRWLKAPGEAGYDDADARLLDDDAWSERLSFYYRSARSFPARAAPDAPPVWYRCEDIAAGCPS